MKVGNIIQDYQWMADKGIILVIDKKNSEYFVLAFGNAHASWLPERYIKRCKVVG